MKEVICYADCGEYVPVERLVRCKDCKHFRKEEKAMVANQYCSNLHRAVTNNWFCADGERQEGR